MEINARDLYREWYDQTISRISTLRKQSRRLSWLRLFVFVAFAAAGVLAFIHSIWLIYLSLFLLCLFIYLLVYHEKVNFHTKFNETFHDCVKDELAALDYNYTFNPGTEYTDPSHPFTFDLDIFGNDSIFHSLNRTATVHGSRKLSDLFINPSLDRDIIIKKQEAVKELSAKAEWLLRFRTYGLLGNTGDTSEKEIIAWAGLKPLFLSLPFTILLYLIPILSVGMIVLVSTSVVSFNNFFLYMMIPLGLSGIFASRINKRHMQVSRKASMLNNYASRLLMVENENFDSKMMQQLQKDISYEGKSSSYAIKQLSRIISSMDARLNWIMWIILNYLLLWDIRQMQRLEKWQAKYKAGLPQWFESLATVEALGSLAGYALCNPSFIFPAITDERLVIEGKNAGHPLIPQNRRICNSILIEGSGTYSVVTGANMAGKSTYLRTVGVNLVLGMAGAPVCATQFTFSPAIPYTSLHTVDSLSTNKSYFFAELERLKLIIDTLNSGAHIYVFLDEILKGTNSYDKQNGTKALLKQLINLGAAGMIATHDLDLGQLEKSFPENISNYCFEAVIQDNELHFDYKLKNGIATNMNASFLMKRMGITV